MPGWTMHLKIAEEVSSHLPIQNYDDYMIGNLAPDIKNNFVIEADEPVQHCITHFSVRKGIDNGVPNLGYFIEQFPQLHNSLVLGYYIHLLTDYFWNTKFSGEHLIYDTTQAPACVKGIATVCNGIIPVTPGEFLKIKHSDMFNYGNTITLSRYDFRTSAYFKIEADKLFQITEGEISRTEEFVRGLAGQTTSSPAEDLIIGPTMMYDDYMARCVEFIIVSLRQNKNLIA
jgi:hypothetical protein